MTCSGKCCERIRLDLTKREVRAVRAMKVLYPSEAKKFRDAFYIADMVIPSGRGYYNCKHYNKKTKKCLKYAERPNLCRAYPHGRKCCYDDVCTFTGSSSTPTSQFPDLIFMEKVARHCELHQKKLWNLTRF